jgi:uncharacterized membrane protein YhaH (DUF805 family)
MKWYLHAIQNYANFYGRASRTEYWMFALFNLVFAVLCYSTDLIFDLHFGKFGIGIFYGLYLAFSLVPSLAIGVRRLHDVGKSGSYLLLAIIPLIGLYILALFCERSEEEYNAYGDKPINNDIAPFINDDKTNSRIIIISLFWLFFSRIIWSIITLFVENFYQNEFFKQYNEIMSCIWMFFPLFLSLSIKNHKWKIILLICSAIYMIYGFYELVKSHILTSDNFQF